jgi:hypothetical protein
MAYKLNTKRSKIRDETPFDTALWLDIQTALTTYQTGSKGNLSEFQFGWYLFRMLAGKTEYTNIFPSFSSIAPGKRLRKENKIRQALHNAVKSLGLCSQKEKEQNCT